MTEHHHGLADTTARPRPDVSTPNASGSLVKSDLLCPYVDSMTVDVRHGHGVGPATSWEVPNIGGEPCNRGKTKTGACRGSSGCTAAPWPGRPARPGVLQTVRQGVGVKWLGGADVELDDIM